MQRESQEVVTARIINVAAELFAARGISGVSIRQIAAEAGINHALIIRYFGSKDALVTEILKQEIRTLIGMSPAQVEQSGAQALAVLRNVLLNAFSSDKSALKLIVRAELDGLSPASYLDTNNERAANIIAKWLEIQRNDENLPDPKLVTVVVLGAIFSLVSIPSWLMTAVGLSPADFESRKEEILDIVLWIVAGAAGMAPGAASAT